MTVLKSFLCGEWVTGTGEDQNVYNATTGEPIATVNSGGLDRGAALRYGRTNGGPALRGLTFEERGSLLKSLSAALHSHRDELISLSCENGGTTRSDGKFDIDGAIGTLAYYAGLGRKLGSGRVLKDGDSEPVLRSKRFIAQHIKVPRRGVAVHINAFNFPAWGLAEKLAVSFLAGVAVLTKPGTATAVVAVRMVEIWHEQGLLPKGSLQLLTGSPGDLLEHLESQDCVAFTGGTQTARKIRGHHNIVANHIPVNIEADSLNASILGPDVEPDSDTWWMFINDVVRDMTQKCGQKCTAVRRIFVPLALADAAVEALTDRLGEYPVGDPAVRGTRIGPVSSASQQRSVQAGVEALQAACDEVWVGDAPQQGYFVMPRLFRSDRGLETEFVHEHEVFGPVSTVLTWDGDVAGAAELVSAGGGGLVCSMYSDDLSWAGELLLELAPWHGRILWGSKKIHDQSPGPGTVLPNLVHGGPGKAGGGSELGGLRGLDFYLQRTAVQADRGLLARVLGDD